MTAPTYHFVCPACKGPLTVSPVAYACDRCPRTYPIVLGIPDFRLETDPFITIADDRTNQLIVVANDSKAIIPALDFAAGEKVPVVSIDIGENEHTHQRGSILATSAAIA